LYCLMSLLPSTPTLFPYTTLFRSPSMRAIHEASCLRTPEEAAGWRGKTPAAPAPPPASGLIPLEPFSNGEIPQDSIEEVIMRRGDRKSTRLNSSHEWISYAVFCLK